MIVISDKKDCCGCTACGQVCPKDCIKMTYDEEGLLYPILDESKCIDCGLCEKVCPIVNSSDKHPVISTLGVYSKNDELRLSSSSGGFFSIIGEHVIGRGGSVVATKMSDDCQKAVFSIANTVDELKSMRGSKYLQSDLDDTFSKIKALLRNDTLVLFVGTPCQVNGLKLFLRSDFENLITIDIICHGCPSPKVWKKYIEEIEFETNSRVVQTNFRCKQEGWRKFGLQYQDECRKIVFSPKESDPYMQFFLRNISLRPSCFYCKSKTYRLSDLTIGDFWGIENVNPEFDDGNGVTAVIARTKKGNRIFDDIKDSFTYFSCSYEDIVKYNCTEYKSVPYQKYRNRFFKDLDEYSIRELSQKYLKKTISHKIKCAIKNALKILGYKQ